MNILLPRSCPVRQANESIRGPGRPSPHGGHHGNEKSLDDVIGFHSRLNDALLLDPVVHDADVVLFRLPLLGRHFRSLQGDSDRATMGAGHRIKGKFLIPYEYGSSAGFADRPVAASVHPAPAGFGVNRSFSLFVNGPSTNPI